MLRTGVVGAYEKEMMVSVPFRVVLIFPWPQGQVKELESALERERVAREQLVRELEQSRTSLQEVKTSLNASTTREHTLQKTLER